MRLRWTGFPVMCLFLAANACTVEPRMVVADAGPAPRYDAGPLVDAGARDAGARCRLDYTCPSGTFCADNGACEAVDRACAVSTQCAPGDACLRPLVASSSVTPGRCGTPARACVADTGCEAGERCTAVGWCGPAAQVVQFSGSQPQPLPQCAISADCGPGGVCNRVGECVACTRNSDCGGGLICTSGACFEPDNCLAARDCFPGNTCGDEVTCTRSVAACTPDPENDALAGATPVESAHYDGLSICGEDVDWYAIPISANHGLRVAVLWPRREVGIEAELLWPSGALVEEATRLELPGLLVFEVPLIDFPAGLDPRGVRLQVFSRDQSGAYALDVRNIPGLCAGDALDLYGDESYERALFAFQPTFTRLRTCPGDVDLLTMAVESNDIVRAQAAFGPSVAGTRTSTTNVELEIIDAAGVRLSTGGFSTSTSTESASTPRLTGRQSVAVRVTSKQTAVAGWPYELTLERDLGTRFAVCQSPPEITLSGGRAVVPGELLRFSDLGRPRCSEYAPEARHDRLYRFVPPSAPAIMRTIVHQTGGTGAVMSVGVLGACADDGRVLGCGSGYLRRNPAVADVELSNTDAVYIMVSSDAPAEDVLFELEVLFVPFVAPENDVCTAATEVATSTTIVVSTWGAANDDQLRLNNLCGFVGDGAGPDRFYRLDMAAGERAAVELSGAYGGFMWAGRFCGLMTETCTTAATIDLDTPVARARLAPGQDRSYFVAVDGLRRADRSFYDFRVVREPDIECFEDRECTAPLRCGDYRCVSAPVNDVCPGSLVTLDAQGFARIQGTTGAARLDHPLECTPRSSADVVYRVAVPSAASELRARVTRAAFDPALGIRFEACDSGPGVACEDDAQWPEVLLPEAAVAPVRPGNYYVIVGGFAGSGAFTLELELVQ